MAYIVTEVQIDNAGKVATITNDFPDAGTAQQNYYTILAAAAVSKLRKHAAFLYTEDGYVAHQCFEHDEEETR